MRKYIVEYIIDGDTTYKYGNITVFVPPKIHPDDAIRINIYKNSDYPPYKRHIEDTLRILKCEQVN
jgi:hypothetical protein